MPSADHDVIDGDDELALYVAAFRTVEQPSASTHAASWQAIAAQTSESRRVWPWVAAAATLLAATWLLWSAGAVQQLFFDDRGTLRDQAGYVPSEDAQPLPVEDAQPRRDEQPRSVAPVEETPVVEAPPVVEEAPVVIEEELEKPRTKKRDDKPAPSLAEETALFGEIQQALNGGQAGRALSLIGKHEKDFPRGAFRQERTVAKAQALCAAGKRDSARTVRDKFLERYPASHLAARMRAVCPG